MSNNILTDYRNVEEFIKSVFIKEGYGNNDSSYVAKGLVHASLRGVDSHGIRLFPHYLKELKSGRINKNPNYKFNKTATSCATLDADHSFGMAAGIRASKYAVDLAHASGVGIVTVSGSSHFGAASYYGLEISKNEMLGLSLTHSDALVVPTGGKQRFTGNNPICFTAPSSDEDFCLDMATSTITYNKVLQHREENIKLPPDSGIDKDGNVTSNPFEAIALMPVGGYKGYGLAVMVEILCSILTGVSYGPHMVKMFDDDIKLKRNLGHFFMAIRIDPFIDLNNFKQRLSEFMNELRSEPVADPNEKIQVAGDPELIEEKIRLKKGIPLRSIDVENFNAISKEYEIPFYL